MDGAGPGEIEPVDVPVVELEGVEVPEVEVDGVGVAVVEVPEGDGDAEVETGVGEIVLPAGAPVPELASSGTVIFSLDAPGAFCFVTVTSTVAFLGPTSSHSPRTMQD
ncbi:MAG TPA: hypothetical protein VIQ52_15010 [Arthrobacter sp.]